MGRDAKRSLTVAVTPIRDLRLDGRVSDGGTPCETSSPPCSNATARGYVAYCPEIPGANGQGRTRQEARRSLMDAIGLILADRRDDGLRGVPAGAERETVILE